MCTVSFISTKNQFILTSNRDEQATRPLAIDPREEIIDGCKVMYPKDPKAGGTWIATNQNGVVGVLLNGAFIKHNSGNSYSKSRGLILLDVVSNITPIYYFNRTDLSSIDCMN